MTLYWSPVRWGNFSAQAKANFCRPLANHLVAQHLEGGERHAELHPRAEVGDAVLDGGAQRGSDVQRGGEGGQVLRGGRGAARARAAQSR